MVLKDSHKSEGFLDNFSFITTDGEVHRYENQPCYGLLMSWVGYSPKFKGTPAIFVTYHGLTADRKVAERYANWAAKRSPFKDVFLEKSGKKIVENGAILSCNFSAQFMISAAIMMRYKYEYPTICKQWDIFRKYMPDDVAFVFAHFFKRKNAHNYYYCANAPGHNMLDTKFSKEGLKNFLSHTQPHPKANVSDRFFRYTDMSSQWGKIAYGNIKWPKCNKEIIIKDPWGGDEREMAGDMNTLSHDIKDTLIDAGVMDA